MTVIRTKSKRTCRIVVTVPTLIGTSTNTLVAITVATTIVFAVEIGSAYVSLTATCRGLGLRVAREVWRYFAAILVTLLQLRVDFLQKQREK